MNILTLPNAPTKSGAKLRKYLIIAIFSEL